MTRDRSGEAAAIFTSHGVLDAVTTVLAARAVGPNAEANPVVRELLAMGELATIVGICACVAVAAAAWPTAADAVDAPGWIGFAIATVGAIVAVVNLVVVVA
ncbi:hypothetical protein DQW50_00390 [Halorubrum sp. 48-1-W]|uniref:hypothetical protein n=1 Tax=Halorubrum sp. 48-1-W TaxID=2249761 RepID=UPI000DCD2F67|nr:hypothetical protein [Halorubrum sp. 48-1-W]RAW47132.1 hypothetical protein DQW50_00390 [Halorubrum sp. 48-1-W]